MPIRVLIADDAELVRDAVADLIRSRPGFELVAAVASGDAALASVQLDPPDVALIDVRMPGGGASFVRNLLQTSPRTKVIAFSGDTDHASVNDMMQAGAVGYLAKGSPVEAIIASIEQASSPSGKRDAVKPVKPVTLVRPDPDFRTLFESSPGLYLILDPDLVIVAASDAYLQATMTKRADIVGRPLFDVFPENPEEAGPTGERNLRTSMERVRRTLQPDGMAVMKYDIRRPESEGGGFEVRYWMPVNSPVVGPGGRLLYIINRVEDVTEFVRLQQHESEQLQQTEELREHSQRIEAEVLRRSSELQELNRQLEIANNAKSKFLSRMSHELRTPLTAIMGFSELLTLSGIPSEQQAWASHIQRAGSHLLELIEEVLDISRVEAGELSMSVEPVSVAGLLMQTVDLVQPLAQAKGITLRVAPKASGGSYVLGDHQRCKQILINLLSNAIKYNRPHGEVTVEVEERTAGRIRLSVSDTGPGLSAPQISKLFTPFERLDAAQKEIEGTGLGLALSRHLTHAMGGEMGVISEPGKGSTFWVEFASVAPLAVAEAEADRTEPVGVRRYAGPKKLVYVEDTVANINLIEQVLTLRPDVRLIPAMLGGLALELVREHQPQIILLDVHLPDMTGDEVLARLRADPATAFIPVVVLSADATRWQRERLLEAGATAYLTKPIRIVSLLETLDRILDA